MEPRTEHFEDVGGGTGDFSRGEGWAQEQWGTVQLGDERLTKRAVFIGAKMLAHPDASLPKQMGSFNSTQAAYRFFSHEHFSGKDLSLPHWNSTRTQAASSPHSVVLFLQDTTFLSFTHHPLMQGTGKIGSKGRGFLLHSALVVAPEPQTPEIFGLAYQSLWARPREKKESLKWEETLTAIGQPPTESTAPLWVTVGDRESDFFDFLLRASGLNWHSLIRLYQDRTLELSSTGPKRLIPWLRQLPAQTQKKIAVRTRNGIPGREVTLQVAFAPIKLSRPGKNSKGEKKEVSGWCIRCWEEGKVKGQRMEWLLFTTVPVQTIEDALRAINWYECRWLIEEYHKCIKTGCKLEDSQLTTANRLSTLLGFVGILAVQLLQLREQARRSPDQPAKEAVSKEWLLALKSLSQWTKPVKTLRDFWHQVAGLGGFLGRKGDGEPGWQSLWYGFKRLVDAVQVTQALQKLLTVGET